MVSIAFNSCDENGDLRTTDIQDGATIEANTVLTVKDIRGQVVAIIPIHMLLYATVTK